MGTKIFGWLIAGAVVVGGVAMYTMREKTIDVMAATVERGHVESTITAISSGTIRPNLDVRLVAEHAGRVIAVHVEDGDFVEKDQLLIELSHAELDAQVRLAEANLRAARARLAMAELGAEILEDVSETRVNQTEAQRREAQENYERLKALADKNVVPKADLDRLGHALDVAREGEASAIASARETEVREQEIISLEASIEQFEASVELAKSAREKADVRAPFAGYVADIMVDPGAGVGFAMPVVHLVDTSSIYVEAPFDEANAASISKGLMARITVDTYRDKFFYGEVQYIPPTVSINMDLSRTLNVKVRMHDGDTEDLIAGMSADVVLLVDQNDNALYLPTESLVREKYAFIIEDGVARRREVTLGIGNWHSYEILDGVKEGETFVTSVGLRDLVDGVRVNVVEDLGL